MKQYGFIYSNFEETKSFIYSNNIKISDTILIQVFTGIIDELVAGKIVKELLLILPKAKIIGTTTAGEIFRENVLENETVVSITVFEKTKIETILLESNDNEYQLGIEIVKKIVEDNTKVIILFSDGLVSNSLEVIKGIQHANNKVIVCGGKAGDNGYLAETFVFTDKGITKKGIAAVSLTGKELNVTTENSFGWSTIGKVMTITKAENNRIYTIDNINAVEIYKKYLGDEVAKGLPMSATEFPLIVQNEDIKMAKVPFNCKEDGSLSFLSNVQVNDKIQFSYGNVNMLINKSIEIANKLKKKNVEALFVYSCSVRRAFMQGKINLDIAPLNEIIPTFGFFTYGEFYSMNNSNEVLNVTMTILGISEGECNHYYTNNELPKNEKRAKSFFEGKDFGVIKVFTNLVNESTKELEQAYKILEEQKYKVEQMNNITKSILQINSEMISHGEFHKFLQITLERVLNIIPNGKIGSILLLENSKLSYKATKGYILDKIKDVEYDWYENYIYETIDIARLFNPIIINNLEDKLTSKSYGYDLWKKMLSDTPRQLLTCGMGIDGEIIGLINIFNTADSNDFTEDDKNLLKYLCYDIAIALKNFNLLDNIIHMSRFDKLTGIYNRHYFMEILDSTLNKARISKTTFTVCMIDLNNLKIINDTYGHEAGDKALITFSNAFKEEIKSNDVFARLGGDEFVAIFNDKNIEEGLKIIQKVYGILENEILNLNEEKIKISFAYGLAEFIIDSDEINELLKIADKRMYERKKRMKEKKK